MQTKKTPKLENQSRSLPPLTIVNSNSKVKKIAPINTNENDDSKIETKMNNNTSNNSLSSINNGSSSPIIGNNNKSKIDRKVLGKKLWKNNESKITKQGWMDKKGGFHKVYKRRWFVLCQNGYLYYFDKRPNINNKYKDMPNGFLNLIEFKETNFISHKSKNGFQLINKNHYNSDNNRIWQFLCDTHSDVITWMTIINNAIKQ